MISEKLKHGFLSFLKMVSNGRIIHIESIEINYSDRPISIVSMYGNDIRILEGHIVTTIKVTGKYAIWDIELVDMERKFQSTFSSQLNGAIIKLDYSVLGPNNRW
jgi:hypothetical protein